MKILSINLICLKLFWGQNFKKKRKIYVIQSMLWTASKKKRFTFFFLFGCHKSRNRKILMTYYLSCSLLFFLLFLLFYVFITQPFQNVCGRWWWWLWLWSCHNKHNLFFRCPRKFPFFPTKSACVTLCVWPLCKFFSFFQLCTFETSFPLLVNREREKEKVKVKCFCCATTTKKTT